MGELTIFYPHFLKTSRFRGFDLMHFRVSKRRHSFAIARSAKREANPRTTSLIYILLGYLKKDHYTGPSYYHIISWLCSVTVRNLFSY